MNQTEPEPSTYNAATRPTAKPSTVTAAENWPTTNTSTGRLVLLPTPTLPVYNLRVEDFDINDITYTWHWYMSRIYCESYHWD